ncbi:MAG: hypothetical protein ACRDRN_15810 [Sciscionella sp.]
MRIPTSVFATRKQHLLAAILLPASLALAAGCGTTSMADTATTPTTDAAAAPVVESPAAVDTTTVQPTTTTPQAPPPAPPQVVHGSGDDVVPVTYGSGVKILEFSCPRCSGNTMVQSDGFESLLVNTIGSYSGKLWMDVRDGSSTSQLTVKATGSWTLTVGSLDLATVATGPVSGHGDDVVIDHTTASTAAISNKGGSGNFVVYNLGVSTGMINLVVNTIGGYSGTDPIDLPGAFQVTSDGSWTIAPQ